MKDTEFQVHNGMFGMTVWVGTRINRKNQMVTIVTNASALLRHDIGKDWSTIRAKYLSKGWTVREKS